MMNTLITNVFICIISLFSSSFIYAQQDTIVKTNNILLVGEILDISRNSITMFNSEDSSKINIGTNVVAYVVHSDGRYEKYKYTKWYRKQNKDPLLKNGFYFDFEQGISSFSEMTWKWDPDTDVTTFYERTTNIPRFGICVGNRWSVYKAPNYALSLGINWLAIAFSPVEFNTLLEMDLYNDWLITLSPINPVVTNTFVLNEKSAIEQFVIGGYTNFFGETNGFNLKIGGKYRYRKIGVGINYEYARTKDYTYGFPNTLNTINVSFGLKF